MLRILFKNSESVGDPGGFRILLRLQELIELFKLAAAGELDVPSGLSHEFIARSDVALNNFLEVLKELFIAYLQLLTDRCAWRFLKLLDIDVNNVVGKEFPSKSYVVWAF